VVGQLKAGGAGSTFGCHEVARLDQIDTIDETAAGEGPLPVQADSGGGGGIADLMPTFLGELARAMQAAAQREQKRIARVIADEATRQVETTRTRAAAEAEELRRLAEADVERVQAWAAAEIERIRSEAERRTAERRQDLGTYLVRHESIIATEIDGVEAAVREYDQVLARFFDDLAGMTDPADIVRRAGSLPTMPDLDTVRATARAGAVAAVANAERAAESSPGGEGTTAVGVMDPAAVGRPADASAAVAGPAAVAGRADAEPSGVEPSAVESAAPSASAEGVDESGPTTDPVAVDAPANGSANHANAAVRVLRTLAPWAAPGSQESAERSDPPH
jgi:hypothetical protein